MCPSKARGATHRSARTDVKVLGGTVGIGTIQMVPQRSQRVLRMTGIESSGALVSHLLCAGAAMTM